MESQWTVSTVLGNAVIEWLAEQALHETEPATLYGELCQRLRSVGIPVLRGQVAFRILHPLYDASAVNWHAERGVVVDLFSPEDIWCHLVRRSRRSKIEPIKPLIWLVGPAGLEPATRPL